MCYQRTLAAFCFPERIGLNDRSVACLTRVEHGDGKRVFPSLHVFICLNTNRIEAAMKTLTFNTETPVVDSTLDVFQGLTRLSAGELVHEAVRLSAEMTPSQWLLLVLVARRADTSQPDAARTAVVLLHVARLISV